MGSCIYLYRIFFSLADRGDVRCPHCPLSIVYVYREVPWSGCLLRYNLMRFSGDGAVVPRAAHSRSRPRQKLKVKRKSES